MGKPSEASHSRGIRVFGREGLELGSCRRARGQQVVFMGRGQGAERGNGPEAQAWDPSCFLGKEKAQGNKVWPL